MGPTHGNLRDMAPGLRERKKQQTRQALSDTATRLFLARGFEAVTIAEIAEAAQVAKMTVTNHFPRKEDLALDIADPFTASLAATVGDRRPGESALAALRRAYRVAVDERSAMAGFTSPQFARMLTASPALTARLRELHEQREDRLARRLADETRASAADVRPRVAAAQLGGTHRVLFGEALRRCRAGEPPGRVAAALRRAGAAAFDLLAPSLGDYAVRPGD